jgi:Skp family chaperone for outer membrane proteins
VEEINRDVQKRNHEIEQEEKRKEEKISEQIRAIMQRVSKWVSFSFVIIEKILYFSQRFFNQF